MQISYEEGDHSHPLQCKTVCLQRASYQSLSGSAVIFSAQSDLSFVLTAVNFKYGFFSDVNERVKACWVIYPQICLQITI